MQQGSAEVLGDVVPVRESTAQGAGAPHDIEHVVVLDKSLLQGISAGKGMFDSAMEIAGATGFTSGTDQINSFLPSRKSQSQQIIDSMFDVSWDNGMEDRARNGSSGSNTMSVGDMDATCSNLVTSIAVDGGGCDATQLCTAMGPSAPECEILFTAICVVADDVPDPCDWLEQSAQTCVISGIL